MNLSQRVKAIGVAGSLAFVGFHGFDGGALLKGLAPNVSIGKAGTVPSITRTPKVEPNRAAAAEAKASKAKTAAGFTVVGAGALGLVEAQKYGIEKGAPVLEQKLEAAQKKSEDKAVRGGYCESIPALKDTEGCK